MKHCTHDKGPAVTTGNTITRPQICCFCGEQRNLATTFVYPPIPGHGPFVTGDVPGVPQVIDPWGDEDCRKRRKTKP